MKGNRYNFEYSHENYISFGFNGEKGVFRKSPLDNFFLRYEACKNKSLIFSEELIRAAKLINEKTSRPKWVCFSGGMDSEVTLRAFRMANVPVNAAILRYAGGINEHDICYALSYCKKFDVPYKVYDLDLEFFYKNQLNDFLYIQCTSPQFYPVLWLMEKIIEDGGCPIVGSGDACIKRVKNTNDFNFYEQEMYFTYYYYLLYHGQVGVPAFLQYTPELFYSFLTSEKLLEYINGRAKRDKLISISKWKWNIYNSFFPIEKRAVYNGFEYALELDQKYRSYLSNKFYGANDQVVIEYDHLIQVLKGPN